MSVTGCICADPEGSIPELRTLGSCPWAIEAMLHVSVLDIAASWNAERSICASTLKRYNQDMVGKAKLVGMCQVLPISGACGLRLF